MALLSLHTNAATAAPARPEPTRPAAAASRPASPEAAFLIAVHQGNLAQIRVGKLAAQKSANRTVRRLGKQFAAGHRTLDAQVRKVAEALSVRLPAEPNSEQLALADRYRAATATDFDTLFIDTQLSWYERATRLARLVLAVSDDPAIAGIVADASPMIAANRLALTTARDELTGDQQ